MSELFKEVELKMNEEDPALPPKTIEFSFDPEKLAKAISEIKQEIEKIRTGESDLTKYPIDPGNFSFPAGNRLAMLQRDSSDKNFTGFIEIVKQDLGLKAALHFTKLLGKARIKTNE